MTKSGRRLVISEGPAGAVRETAFALLLAGRRPVAPAAIAAALTIPGPTPDPILVDLGANGWIDRDDDGAITRAAGLSLTDGPHRLTLGAAEFRNWCAYDSLGIGAALEADATVTTACPVCGVGISIAIEAGRPPTDRSAPMAGRRWRRSADRRLRADGTPVFRRPCRGLDGRAPARPEPRRRPRRGGDRRSRGVASLCPVSPSSCRP